MYLSEQGCQHSTTVDNISCIENGKQCKLCEMVLGFHLPKSVVHKIGHEKLLGGYLCTHN